MKKLFLGLLATIMLGTAGNAKEAFTKKHCCDNELEPLKITVRVHLDIGRKSMGCKGFGICGIDVDIPIDFAVNFTGGANEKGNLVIETNDFGALEINKYFGSNFIILEEDFTLSDKACKVLGLKTGYTLKTGKYELLLVSKGQYIIKF